MSSRLLGIITIKVIVEHRWPTILVLHTATDIMELEVVEIGILMSITTFIQLEMKEKTDRRSERDLLPELERRPQSKR